MTMDKNIAVSKHFVEFGSPGTFVAESTVLPIDAWSAEKAVEMSHGITERYGARPYGFRFLTRSRGPSDLDSKVTARSNFYWLGGTIRTAEQVLAGDDPKEEILRSNVRCNDYKRIITNDNSWRFTSGMKDDDVVLDYAPSAKTIANPSILTGSR